MYDRNSRGPRIELWGIPQLVTETSFRIYVINNCNQSPVREVVSKKDLDLHF